jgi:hypothetical protein
MILYDLVNCSALKRFRHCDTADVDGAHLTGDRFRRFRTAFDYLIDQRAAAEIR